MGSIDPPKSETAAAEEASPPAATATATATAPDPPGNEPPRRRRSSGVLPLEVGTRVLCRWRDGKFHPVKVIERRKVSINRRLDEWVKLGQLDLDSVETVVGEKVEEKVASLKMTQHQKFKIDETHVEGNEELDAASLREHEEFTKVKILLQLNLEDMRLRHGTALPFHQNTMIV